MPRAAYRIRVVGSVPEDVLEDFLAVSVTHEPAGSTILAEIVDDAQLHGVLDALRRGGFELVDVHRDTTEPRAD